MRKIGYDNADLRLRLPTPARCINAIDKQSPDIAQGVDAAYETRHDPADEDELDVAGAGDQGMMFGYATQRDRRADAAADLARAQARQAPGGGAQGRGRCPTCAPTARPRSRVRYQDGKPVEIEKILISTQHADGIDAESLIKPTTCWEHVARAGAARATSTTRSKLRKNFLVNPTGRFVIGGPMGDCGPDRAQDHRRHLRRHGPPRRRRLLRQGPLEGRPLGRLRRALGGQEHRRRRPRRPRRGAGRLRDRRRAPGLGDGRDVRHREDRPRRRSPELVDETSTCARAPSARSSTCTGRSTRRPPPTATSAATTTTSRGSAPTRPTALRAAAGL